MGYYTWYEFENVTGEHAEDFKRHFDEGVVEAEYGWLHEMFAGVPGSAFDEMQWYERIEDMTRISILYPNTLFVINGRGEDHDDVWKEYYRNGMVERVYPTLVYSDPSPELIQNQPMVGTAENEDIADVDF